MCLKNKAAALLCAVMVFVLCQAFVAFAEDEKEEAMEPVYAESLVNGTYDINVQSSASMFKIVACELTVSDSDMIAVMTLSGKGYEKLYMGTGEQALTADETDYIFFQENDEGKYTYTVPVEALNMSVDCAAFSFKKQQWYDRTLIFEADSLPEGAFVKEESPAFGDALENAVPNLWVVYAGIAAVVIVIGVAVVVIIGKARKDGKAAK